MSSDQTCPDVPDLQALLAGSVPEETASRLQRHLDACEDCQRRLAELVEGDDAVEDVAAHLRDPRPDPATSLLKAIRKSSPDPVPHAATTDGSNDLQLPLDFLSPADSPDVLGRVGPYEITEVIGRGGMGIVLKGQDAKLHRVVAIKVLAPEMAGNATARRRFLREAQAAAAVTHQHVVTIHAVDEDRLPYLVMEFVDGFSLQEKIDRQGTLDLKEVLRIGFQIASGLAAAHAQGVVHRDIKPSNILLENGVERVRITDFGLARAVDDVAVTRTGEVAGTPQYMSPEQAQGHTVDARSDLFNLGCVLYAMCTGRSPFRAETTVAAIRRVCDDAPRPIREVNSDVPDWLAEIIDRLLRKDPDERFQTACEVSELLGRHLAHLQDPGSTPPPESLQHTLLRRSRLRRYWLIATVALLLATLSLAVTEATDVTDLAGTVIRIVMGEGTLVIEVDDPTVQVSLDGKELSITGAGIQELRLRPGQYRFSALKDGEPLQSELVTITRGDRRVVHVALEATPPRRADAADLAEPGAFVLLGGEGFERQFDTLAEAVAGSSQGDTIEVRSNGPFVTDSVDIRHALAIRAASGFRPVIRLKSDSPMVPLLETNSSLLLEGLELQRLGPDPFQPEEPRPGLVTSYGVSVRAANCRFLAGLPMSCVHSNSQQCVARNCEFIVNSGYSAIFGNDTTGARTTLDNCVVVGCSGTYRVYATRDLSDAFVTLRRNTFVHDFQPFGVTFFVAPVDGGEQAGKPFRVDTSRNIIHADQVLLFNTSTRFRSEQFQPLHPSAAEARLVGLLDWHGRRNLFSIADSYWQFDPVLVAVKERLPGPENLAEWMQFWQGAEVDSLEGRVRFQGGDLLSKLHADPAQLTPDDFRLRPDSPGYRAGPDGEDLGADIDLVGPGAAYERWKQTPDYAEWLEESEPLMAGGKSVTASDVVTRGAFAILGAVGFRRNYDTLAEAVRRSSPRDTIEVCGNGPFITGSISIPHPLTIRAAGGFRPIIQSSAEGSPFGSVSLQSEFPLVLEGLELRCTRLTTAESPRPAVEALAGFFAANCRFIAWRPNQQCIWSPHGTTMLINCELLKPGQGSTVSWKPQSNRQYVFKNCVHAGGVNLNVQSNEYLHGISIELHRNTFVGRDHIVDFSMTQVPSFPEGRAAVHVQMSENIYVGGGGVMQFVQGHLDRPLGAAEAEALLQRFFEWHEHWDLYAAGLTPLRLETGYTALLETSRGQDLDDWNRFWGLSDTGSFEGEIRFTGGNLAALAQRDTALLTPDDFRLRPDSAGYHAGPDGEDLGADIDFVGPGEAYERWKQTSDYGAWLQQTAQLMAAGESTLPDDDTTPVGETKPQPDDSTTHN